MSKAIIVAGYEFHMVNGKLFITSEENPDTQVALSPEAVKALVEYIYNTPHEDEPREASELVRYILN